MVGGLVVSAAMADQDLCGGTRSNTAPPAGDGISLNAGLHAVTGPQLKEQFTFENDYSPKVRKPYTITKQRERWTEDEHKKFLEALKLYGRAWRRIEEHVGTKTAVQIRSHAQKFFSKVVREASGNNTSTLEPIEIPPPRPKRKPMHPYPRKMVHPLNNESSIPEQPLRSSSPNYSISEQENQSPTSVLSAVGSDALGSIDSNTPNSSLSPVSCAGGSHPADSSICEPNLTPEDHGSTSPAPTTAAALDEQSPKVEKLGLYPRENVFSEEGLAEETSTRSLKLFGRTVLVTESPSHRPSSPTIGNSKLLPLLDTNDRKPVQSLPWNFMATELQHGNGECTWSHLSHGPPGTLYCLQFQKENSNSVEAGSAAPLPLWAFCGGMPFPLVPFHKQEPLKVHLDSNGEEIQDKEIHKEGSWTGSNSGSVNEGENVDKNIDGETQSPQLSYEEKEPHTVLELKPSEKSASTNKCVKGFVPYKKRMAERDGQSSTITGEEREEQRIRLCL
ncbi:hypothetical protein P3X46_016111 [Hevea brasiliensis]|uniref:Uncharacterized protein n=1 Tax=Hevea brasiliensis TaxID=3981 RepID=A0ABQ9LZF4_HEVBR|nr:protein REVEILLE 1 [Hevea brasiliensis]KAJ9172922.1 hypothetical protein P3X46_016111 [Hevea brasiliensis]KAJ9172923.1 hypothetical protein P3X46_016111 [Hevea brasiliensis]